MAGTLTLGDSTSTWIAVADIGATITLADDGVPHLVLADLDAATVSLENLP